MVSGIVKLFRTTLLSCEQPLALDNDDGRGRCPTPCPRARLSVNTVRFKLENLWLAKENGFEGGKLVLPRAPRRRWRLPVPGTAGWEREYLFWTLDFAYTLWEFSFLAELWSILTTSHLFFGLMACSGFALRSLRSSAPGAVAVHASALPADRLRQECCWPLDCSLLREFMTRLKLFVY